MDIEGYERLTAALEDLDATVEPKPTEDKPDVKEVDISIGHRHTVPRGIRTTMALVRLARANMLADVSNPDTIHGRGPTLVIQQVLGNLGLIKARDYS